MALSKLTDQEIEDFVKQGYKREDLEGKEFEVVEPQAEPMSGGRAALSPLKAHAGGLLGGGATGLAGWVAGAALAPETGGLSLAIPLISSILGGVAGGAVGQKIQEKVQGEETTRALEEELALAKEQHPFITPAAEISAAALVGGGRPSLSTIPRALRGERQAIANLALNSALNPAINSGVTYATTGELPKGSDILKEAIGGAIFSGQTKWASRLMGHPIEGATKVEPSAEPNAKGEVKTTPLPKGEETVNLDEIVGPSDSEILQPTREEVVEDVSPPAKTDDVLPAAKEVEKVAEELRLPAEEQEELERMKLNAPPREDAPGKKEYDEVSVKMGQLAKEGKYDTDEFKALWKTREEIKNKFAGGHVPGDGSIVEKPPTPSGKTVLPSSISTHIQEGKATVKSVLELMSKEAGDNDFTPLAQHLLKTADPISLEKKIATFRSMGTKNEPRSHYQVGENIHLEVNDVHDTHTVMHEVIHSTVSDKLPKEFAHKKGAELKAEMDRYLKEGSNSSVKELIQTYHDVAKALGVYDSLFVAHEVPAKGKAGVMDKLEPMAGMPDRAAKAIPHGYAMGDLHEFTAMVTTNKKFQQHMNEIPSGLGDGKSMWTRIVDAVRNILGLDVKQGSMLERALKSTNELIAQEHPSAKSFDSNPATKVNSPPATVDEKPQGRMGFFKALESTFDKVGHVAPFLQKAAKGWQATRDSFNGMKNAALVDLDKYDRSIVNKVMAIHRDAYRKGETEVSLKGKEKEVSDIFRNYYGKIADVRREMGIKIDGREAGKNDLYIPDQLSDKTLDLFTKHATSPEAIHAENVWVDHVFKEAGGRISKDKIRNDVQDYIAALGGSKNNYKSLEFGAIRRMAGFGLPEGLRELDAFNSLSKYGSRAANDLAFYKHFEGDNKVAGSLKLKDAEGKIPFHPEADSRLAAHEDVKDMMKWVTNSFTHHDTPKINSVVRVINNALLGTATGLRDTASILQNMSPYINKSADLGAFVRGIANFRTESRNALLTGAKQPSIDKVQFNMVMDSPDRFAGVLNKVATGLRKWQGREALENINREITFSVGKELALSNIIGAKSGHKASQSFLDKFNTNVPENVLTLKGAELDTALNQIAKNFTDTNQGSYGGAGLPVGIVNSQFAPFFSLQKWSVEKSNVIFKDVIKPAYEGKNFLPLINYTLSGLLTGAAIQQLNSLLTGRKGQDPTVKEALDSADPVAIASELATIMQLASFGGIVGDLTKATSDIVLHGKTPRNIVSFPTATAALDLQEKTTDMMEALRLGEDPWEVWKQYSLDMITHNVQLVRMVANRTVNKEQIGDSDKFRDVRVFNELEGKQNKDYTPSNKYLNLEGKEFKKEQDLGKAMEELPTLIGNIIKKYGDKPEEMRKKLQGLKSNSYQTMPNMQNAPIAFMRYLNFLQKRDGEEKASEVMLDYIRRNAINKAKSSAIP